MENRNDVDDPSDYERWKCDDDVIRWVIMHSSKHKFDIYDVNKRVDVYTLRPLLKVSPSVVSLVSYSGGEEAFSCSGVIFGSFWKDDSLNYSVLTSATLLKPPLSHFRDSRKHSFTKHRLKTRLTDDNKKDFSLRQCRKKLVKPDRHRKRNFHLKQCRNKPDDHQCVSIDEEIDVYLRGGNLCVGTVASYDPHYNIAVLTFKSENRIPCAVLRPLDDSLAFNREPTNEQDSAHHVPYHPLKLLPGDPVIAVGRLMQKSFDIMAAPGKYSVDRFDENNYFNCLELFRTDCKITKCGIGGPLISFSGEVIGINFYSEHCTPFLPINIFLKWWSHQKVTRGHCRPSLGMKVANLHTADSGTLDQVQKLGISQGLIVEKVLSGSPAETCGLCPGDIVIKCSDTTIVSPLQFFEIVWGMAGKAIEIVVVREGSYKSMKIEVKDITSADEFYQWLLPREYMRRVA